MAEHLGTFDASPKPGLAGLTITLAVGEDSVELELVEKWPNVLKLRIGYLNLDDTYAILELLISPKPAPVPEGEVLAEGERPTTYVDLYRRWYVRTEADDRALVGAIDSACQRLNGGRPLADVAPLLALYLVPEQDGSVVSVESTPASASTTTTGETSPTASTKQSGETNSTEPKANGSKSATATAPSTQVKSIRR